MNLSFPFPLQAHLQKGTCHVIAEVQHKDGNLIPFIPFDLSLSDDGILFLSLEQERSRVGVALVDSLWFDRPLYLWFSGDTASFRITLRAHRIHIVGRHFYYMLHRARSRDPQADIDAVWELRIEEWEETAKPLPQPFPCSLTGERDCHLDHQLLSSCNFYNN